MNDHAATIREQLIALLGQGPLGVRELSQLVHQSEKEVYDHLLHIRRSLRAEGRRLEIAPAECLACGFVFADRDRLHPPGRCPRCRASRIRRPRYHLGR